MKTKNVFGALRKSRQFGITLVLILAIIVFSIASPKFLTFDNIITVLRQVSVNGIIAVGMTFIMLTGAIDLSVGSLAALCGVITAKLIMEVHIFPLIAIFIGILVSTLCGTLMGIIISKTKIPALIVTLGFMNVWRGLAYIITGGLPISGLPRDWGRISQGYVFGVIPCPVIIMIIVYLAGGFILEETWFGRRMYAVGGSEVTSKLSGINVDAVRIFTFSVCGFLTGLAGILLMFRINSGQPSAGNGTEMDVITGVALGGISLSGGEGKLLGVFIGVLIIGILSNGLIIIGISDYVQMVVKGLVLVFAVGMDSFTKRMKA